MTDHTNERQAAFGQAIQFQSRNELHRHFSGDYMPRKVTPKRIAKRAAVVAAVTLAVYAVLRFRLWEIWIPK